MKRVTFFLSTLLALAAIFNASLFAFAEIYTEVAVLRTFAADGSPHETRLMVIDIADTPWVRGRPYRGWFRRIEANPHAELYRGDASRPITALISREFSDAAEFEREMVERYGLPYRAFDFVARMSSHEIPVRLEPRNP